MFLTSMCHRLNDYILICCKNKFKNKNKFTSEALENRLGCLYAFNFRSLAAIPISQSFPHCVEKHPIPQTHLTEIEA